MFAKTKGKKIKKTSNLQLLGPHARRGVLLRPRVAQHKILLQHPQRPEASSHSTFTPMRTRPSSSLPSATAPTPIGSFGRSTSTSPPEGCRFRRQPYQPWPLCYYLGNMDKIAAASLSFATASLTRTSKGVNSVLQRWIQCRESSRRER